MNESPIGQSGRRRMVLRRLFFLVCITTPLASAAWRQADTGAPGHPDARIVERLARLTRDQAGHHRIIESLTFIAPENEGQSKSSAPLRLVQLSSVTDVRVLGGDVGPRQVAYDPPDLMIVDSVEPGELQVVFTYVVMQGVRTFEFAAQMPVDEFVLEIQRGSVSAEPGPGFEPNGEGGSATRPFRRYVARRLPAGGAAQIEFTDRRVDWRDRLAVLLGTAAAIVGVMIIVWRRDAAARRSERSRNLT